MSKTDIGDRITAEMIATGIRGEVLKLSDGYHTLFLSPPSVEALCLFLTGNKELQSVSASSRPYIGLAEPPEREQIVDALRDLVKELLTSYEPSKSYLEYETVIQKLASAIAPPNVSRPVITKTTA
jgi:hypothetical protein